MIRLENVSKIYGKKSQAFEALKDVSFTIPDGKSVAIVGKSGSGKSTLMHVMSGLDRASAGRVVVDNQDISELKNKALDRFRVDKIGFIFQSFFVQANETCAQNVSLPLEIARVSPGLRKRRIESALREVGLLDKINSKARDLSGGQKQRLAIARAIVSKPSILFADEPTGNLDSVTGSMIEKLLFSINTKQKTTLIIVTHDDDLARKCDIQINLRDGDIVSQKGVKL